MNKVIQFIKSHKVLCLILLLALFMRSSRALELFAYGHDQDLAGWFVRDIVENHHLRLIGQETSVHGVYIGPLWYYSIVPFYVLLGMSPASGLIVSILVGVITVFSMWFVVSSIFSNRVGLYAALIYAVSFVLVMTDREVNPTITVVLWSIWFLYSLQLILKKKTAEGLMLTAFLFAVSWQINLAFVILAPVSIVALLLSKSMPKVSAIRNAIIVGLVSLSPFLLFEVKNGFLQTKAILGSAVGGGTPVNFAEKLDRTTTLLSKNIRNIYTGDLVNMPDKTAMLSMFAIFAFLVAYRKLRLKWSILFVLWILLYIVFFSHNPLNLSEYYLNGMAVLWVLLPALLLEVLSKTMLGKAVAFLLLAIFVVANITRFETIPVNRSGYIDRTHIVSEIKNDAQKHGYPCVAVSYITTPGNELGYRYLFYFQGLHVNLPKTEAPVYTIVFPHSMVDKIDQSFGALGFSYSDYKKYTKEGIDKSCSTGNQNLTEPLFGFTK